MDSYSLLLRVVPELLRYLDKPSIIHLNQSSTSFLNLLSFHIEKNFIFNTPLSILFSNPPPLAPQSKFLQIYKNTKKVNILNTTLDDGNNNSWSNKKHINLNSILPSSITHLKLLGADTHITDLPPSLIHLTISGCWSVSILPPSLSYLDMITQPHEKDYDLPESLKKVRVRYYDGIRYSDEYGFQSSCSMPPSLSHLEYYYNKNTAYDHFKDLKNTFVITPSLTHLILGKHFCETVDHLPPTLLYLQFGHKLNHFRFDEKFKNKKIRRETETTPSYFNQKINKLPKSLTHLFIYSLCFNRPVDFLPPSLTHFVVVSGCFEQDASRLPPTLTYLFLSNSGTSIQNLLSPLPHLSLLGLFINKGNNFLPFQNTPESLTTLIFCDEFNQNVDFLPPSTHKILFGADFNSPVDHLPHSLTHLIFPAYSMFNQGIDYLPNTLIKLVLGEEFDQAIDYLPPSLTHVTLPGLLDHPADYLPPSLSVLNLGRGYGFPVDHLPSNLKSLSIIDFEQSLHNLPLFLKHLQIKAYTADFEQFCYLPSSLSSLEISVKELDDWFNDLDFAGLLPTSLTHLTISRSMEKIGGLGNLPISLKKLRLKFQNDYIPVEKIGNLRKIFNYTTFPHLVELKAIQAGS